MEWKELASLISKHNEENGVTRQFEDENPIEFVIVYEQSNWEKQFTEKQRSYKSRSDNKYFLPNMCGSSLYGDCLDGIDEGVRLDWYNWKIEKVYLVGE